LFIVCFFLVFCFLQTDRQTYKQTNKQTDWQTDKRRVKHRTLYAAFVLFSYVLCFLVVIYFHENLVEENNTRYEYNEKIYNIIIYAISNLNKSLAKVTELAVMRN